MPEVYKHDKRRVRWPGRAYLLYLLAMPLLPTLFIVPFSGDLVKLLTYYGAFISFIAGARFMKAGLVAEAEFHKRKVAVAPRTPRKLIGSLFTGAGTFICSWLAMGHSLLYAGVLGALTVAGAALFYGRDPKGMKQAEAGSHGYTAEEILAALKEAEDKIRSIEGAALDIRNPELTNRLKRIARRARKIVNVMEDDPAGLRRARRFLNVYLDGAWRVTEGYARTHQRSQQTGELETNFRNVLTTIETVFDEQHQKLLEHDALDLDVQIDVLSQQLKRQGVT